MKIDTWACDICKVQKKETNHWYKGQTSTDPLYKGIHIYEWNVVVNSDCSHLCGIECVTKWMGRELSKLAGSSETKSSIEATYNNETPHC